MRPRLMLLDEPSFGLAPLIVEEVYAILHKLNEMEGVSMLLVEQNATAALALAGNAYLIETGHIVMSGRAQEVGRDETVRRAYLGY
jgi:branched-chain amino acid transport system ATP-binding protein